MRHILLSLFALSMAFGIQAQSRLIGERSVYTQYFMTPYLLNPGATGQTEYGRVIANYRNTWASFEGSPKTVTVGYDGAIGNRIGLGLIGVSDSYAGFGTTKGALNLSYTIESPDNKIAFGIGAEYIQHSLRGEAVMNPFNDEDPLIMERLDGSSYFDASFGLYGEYKAKLIYGVAFPSLVSNKISGFDAETNPDAGISYIGHVGYRLKVEDKDITFEPSVWVKNLLYIPMHVDINLKADFLNESLTAGLTGSVGGEERIGMLIGTQVSNFAFHYSYNVSLHEFQNYNNGSHELGFRIRLKPFNNTTAPVEGN